jgi:protein-L-isoaspartate(D-aspartate) O-methyltransferase
VREDVIPLAPTPLSDSSSARHSLVRDQLSARDIRDPRVLAAFERIPRELFVPEGVRAHAYDDQPLPIGEGQTISQPYIVALTVQSLELAGTERVLEIGTGSGYEAAILSELAAAVYSIERIPSLARSARENLERAGISGVRLACGDGSLGWPEHAPYDAIAVSAGAPDVPPALLSQLAVGGRLVIPVGTDDDQMLMRITRGRDGTFHEEELTPVCFVPLIGAEGWS